MEKDNRVSLLFLDISIFFFSPQKSPLNIFLSINYRTKTEILRFISSVFYGGPDSLKAFGKIPSVMGITPLMFYAVQVGFFYLLKVA